MESQAQFGPFELLTRIAAGGMAVTWLARRHDAPRGDVVVVKRILPALVNDPELRELFAAEVAVAQRLEHPNIVQTLGDGVVDGERYLEMAFVWGEDLRRIAKAAAQARQGLPRVAWARIVADAARGIGHAHALRDPATGVPLDLTHRDVSPPNILVTFDGQVVVVDFGIAKVARRFQQVRAGQLKGKFAYMSPEQVQGLPVTAASDVFSLGVVLYEFAVGRRLFRGASDIETIASVAAAEVTPPRTIDPGFPGDLEEVILRALAPSPADRYASGAELASALDAWVGSAPEASPSAVGDWMKQLFPDRLAELAQYGVGRAGTRSASRSWSGSAPIVDVPAPPPAGNARAHNTDDAIDAIGTIAAAARAHEADVAHTVTDGAAAAAPAAHRLHPPPEARPTDIMEPDPNLDTPDDADGALLLRARKTQRAALIVVVLAAAVVVALVVVRLMHVGDRATTPTPDAGAPDRAALEPLPPSPPPATIVTTVTSEPPGAAIIANGVALGRTTPAEVPLYDGAPNVVSLHLEGYRTAFVETAAGAAVTAALEPFTPSRAGVVDSAEGTGDGSGEDATADDRPAAGRGRVSIRVRNTAGDTVAAEILVNGVPAGNAPLTVDVPAMQDQHITARAVGYRDSVAFTRAPLWLDRRSVRELDLELTAAGDGANRVTTLRVRPTPTDATVTVGEDVRNGNSIYNLPGPGPHVMRIVAPDHDAYVRVFDGSIGQAAVTAVLAPVAAEPATLSLDVEPEGTMVLAERIRFGSPGARQLPNPSTDLPLEAGKWRVALQHTREDGQRVRTLFEVDLAAGANTLRYRLEGDAFVPVTE